MEGSVLREGDVIVTILWKRLSIADDIKEISRIFSLEGRCMWSGGECDQDVVWWECDQGKVGKK